MIHPGGGMGAAQHLGGRVGVVNGDLLDAERLRKLVAEVRPTELYHLAAPSFVPDSWKHPARTMAAVAEATAALLEAVRAHCPTTRVFVAASSAMFGNAGETPQREDTPCHPRNPYAVAQAGRPRDHGPAA